MEITDQLEHLIEILPCSVYWKDREGVYLGCNEYMSKMAGLRSSSEVVGKTDYDMPWHKDADVLRKVDIDVIKSGKPITTEETALLASGKRRIYFTIKLPLIDTTTDTIMGIFGISVDITSQKRTEKKLQEEKRKLLAADREQFNKLVELSQKITGQVLAENATTQEYALHMLDYLEEIIACMPGSVYWKDKNGIYRGGNDYLAKIAGFKSRKEIVGKTDLDFARSFNWDEEMLASVVKTDRRVMETGIPEFNYEEKPFKTAKGQYMIQLSNKVPLFNQSEKVVGLVGISIDITERKKMEQALQKAKIAAEVANKAKSVFISNMSHDIRTPLSGVIGMAEMLEKEGDSEKDREYGHIIHYSSGHLLSLLNDILDIISAEEISEENLVYETFSLLDRIQHVKNLFSSIAETKQVKFEVEKDANLPPFIISDRIKIDRILLNLVSNALKFTEKGYVKLIIKLILIEDLKAIIEFKVIDTGIGISPEKIEHIFERFYRAVPSYESKHQGYGIGLYVVKRFVEMLGGKVSVESELGQGATFSIILPVKIGVEEDVKDSEHNLALIPKTKEILTPSPTLKKTAICKLLFVEDDNIARRTGLYFLEAAGFDVTAVASAEEAFSAVKENSYDLIVSDIGLPGIDGNELTLLVRYWEKKMNKAPIPIVGLSAHTTAASRKESLELGMNLLLEKPLSEHKIAYIQSLKKGK